MLIVIVIGIAVLVGIAMLLDSSSGTSANGSSYHESSEDALKRLVESEHLRLANLSSKQLEAVVAPIPLKRGEICYASSEVVILENRRVRTGTAFAGPTLSIPIIRSLGLRFRAGYLAHAPTVRDKLTALDTGKIYITNRETVFIGENSTRSIRHSELLQLNIVAATDKMTRDANIPFLLTLSRRKGRILYLATPHPSDIINALARLTSSCDHFLETKATDSFGSVSTEV